MLFFELGAIRVLSAFSFHERAGRAQRPSETVWGKLFTHVGRESIVLGTNFQNEDFDGFTRFEVP